jgi:choline monooxygenase
VARTDQLATPGDYASGDCAGEPWVVVRDGDRLRAFHNVCRHHAACVASGNGNTDRLVCPYHGWTYHLDGRLARAPRLGPIQDFSRDDFGLRQLEAALWAPLVFVRVEPGEPSLAELLAPLSGRIETTSLRFVARRSWEIGCNWKVFVDNYLDGGYHVPHMHGGLAAQLDLESYRTEVFDRVSIQSVVSEDEPPAPSGPAGAGDFRERVGGGAVYAYVYPNLMINRYGPIMDTNWVAPLGPDRCLTVFDYWFDAAVAGNTAFVEQSLAASEQVQREDIEVCESVQRGLRSSSYDVGRYAPLIEFGMYQFHRLLARDLRA